MVKSTVRTIYISGNLNKIKKKSVLLDFLQVEMIFGGAMQEETYDQLDLSVCDSY